MTLSEQRTSTFCRNELLEKFMDELSSDLQPSARAMIQRYQGIKSMPHPLILVMGPLRSGTTLLMQWLANTGLIAYPSNLLSRFYQAPIIGAKIQLLLTDPQYNFRDELNEFVQNTEYKSQNGKTKGVLAPNEFWYFWRRFLSDSGRDSWTDQELRQTMNTSEMLAELVGLTQVFQKPFAAKGMLFNYNIPFLDSIFDKVLFVQVRRDVEANAASVLAARKRQFGSIEQWYSFDIPEKAELMKRTPKEQALGQVMAMNSAVETGLAMVSESRKVQIQYEKFCENPEKYFVEITEKIGLEKEIYRGEKGFRVTRAVGDEDG